MIKQVIWSSMVDYPNNVATVLFFDKCNFDCLFCYNKELRNMNVLDFDKEILPKLIERKEFVDHIILSGGECTCNSDFEDVLQKLYDAGFVIGVHTNGSIFEAIERNIDKISFFGIDVKSSWEKYDEITNVKVNVENIKKTIKLVVEKNKDFQIRTTMFPDDVNEDDVIQICNWLKENKIHKYTIQQYYPVGSATIERQYSIDELKQMQAKCNLIVNTSLKYK